MSSPLRRTAALATLLGFGYLGLRNVVHGWPAAQTGAQQAAVAAAVGSGALALASAAALWRGARALGPLLTAWGAAVVAAGLAPWAWGAAPPRVWLPALAAGACLAAAVGRLAWSARAP